MGAAVTRPTIPPEQLQALKDRNPCDQVAGQWVKLRRHGNHSIGPCPLCSADVASRSSTKFEAWDDHWVCAACEQGGDVIRLMMLREGLDFLAVVERLGGTRPEDPVEAERRRAELEAKRQQRDREAEKYRQDERARLFEIWCECPKTIHGTSAERYLAIRGVRVPDTMRLRCKEECAYYIPVDGKRNAWRRIHTGPAMLAPLIGRDHKFAGLHFTYLDLAQPKGKAVILHPDTHEPLPAKKVRGSKKGSRIVLWETPHQPQAATRAEVDAGAGLLIKLVLGEGIEKTAAVWMALHALDRDLSRTACWVAGDIGNMGGKSAGAVTHPELKTDTGRPRRVPGPDPDPADLGIPIPDSVADLVLLEDSTSDPFGTRCAMHRAALRYAREGRTIRSARPPAGKDFDDLLREAA
jgi:hypothetical protein